MGIFTGSAGDDVITPGLVSPGVIATPGTRPSNDADTISGGSGNDTIDASGGANLITGGPGADRLTAHGGADTFVWNPGDGNDTIEGGDGIDTLQFRTGNLAEVIGVGGLTNGHALITRDVAAVAIDANNVEVISFGGGATGSDRFQIGDLSGTRVRQVSIDLGHDNETDSVRVSGRAIDDHITLTSSLASTVVGGVGAQVVVSNADAFDVLAIDGGAGSDILDTTAFLGGIAVRFDGGLGTDELALKGTVGADTVLLGGETAGPFGEAISLVLNGGPAQAFNPVSVETISLDTGAGNDQVSVGSLVRAVSIKGGAGDDSLNGGRNGDTIDGGAGGDEITGGVGADRLLGGDGSDEFVWNPGDGNDTVDGGGGIDSLSFHTGNLAEVIRVGGLTNGHALITRDVAAVAIDADNVEDISFGGGATGSDRFEIGDLSGTRVLQVSINLGHDNETDSVRVSGRAIDDHIALTTSFASTVVSGVGAQVVVSDADAFDVLAIDAGAGNDILDTAAFRGGVVVNFDGGLGIDELALKGTVGADTVLLGGATGGPLGETISLVLNGGPAEAFNPVSVETISLDTGAGNDQVSVGSLVRAVSIKGGAGNDHLDGGRNGDTIDGGVGNDDITGGAGADRLLGGDGLDLFFWNPGDGNDTVDGGSGFDGLQVNASNAAELFKIGGLANGHALLTRDVGGVAIDLDNVEDVFIVGGTGDSDIFQIGDLSGTEVAGIGIDLGLDGHADRVSMSGRAIDERIVVTAAIGGAAVRGGSATLDVTSADAFDQLAIDGGAGNDILDTAAYGGPLQLVFTGGQGSDRYVFSAAVGGHDQIQDFQAHHGGPSGDFIVLRGFAEHSLKELQDNHHIVDSRDGVIINEGGLMLTLKNITLSDLTASDFMFG